MGQLGLGVLIKKIFGNDNSFEAFISSLGKKIKDIRITDCDLIFTFFDESKLKIYDGAQHCCENRYMHTDDDIEYYVDSILTDCEISDGPTRYGEFGEKESEFLKIFTTKGSFTVVNYNEHDGYYGGFCIETEIIKENKNA